MGVRIPPFLFLLSPDIRDRPGAEADRRRQGPARKDAARTAGVGLGEAGSAGCPAAPPLYLLFVFWVCHVGTRWHGDARAKPTSPWRRLPPAGIYEERAAGEACFDSQRTWWPVAQRQAETRCVSSDRPVHETEHTSETHRAYGEDAVVEEVRRVAVRRRQDRMAGAV
ncbi:hypothetical protein CDD83_5364 [Cordyceps sp. RAO-2017]|nr:hypothetical protein CDD83_5364 [Cordyceps sp. RAO-2017]